MDKVTAVEQGGSKWNTGIPLIGDKFPRLEVVTPRGTKVLPDEYKGKWFILFSHPADFTPVCTTEFVAFQKRYDEFRKLNTELIGLSVDQVFVHIKWEEWIKEKLGVEIQFPIIADTGKIAEILGLIHPGKGTNTVRAVFFVDPAGYIRAMLFYPQELGRNFDDFLLMIKGFQLSDSQQVAIPANWPNNELVGDRVIVPPAQDVDTAAKRLEETIATTGGFVTRLRRTRNEEPRRSTFGLLHPGINVIGAQVDSF